MTGVPKRRYAVLAEGRLRDPNAKTAHGLIRYGEDEIAAVIDSTLAGQRVLEAMPELRRDAPIVATVEEALAYGPTSILVGLAPPGGRLPEDWLQTLRTAADAGVEIVSGLHQRLAPLFPGAKVWDVREPPDDVPLFSGEGLAVESKVALTVGTSSAIGKMTATLEIQRAASKAGVSARFVPTGQTGVVIAGWGICVDAVVSDFVAGAAEQLVLRAAKTSPDLVLVEGQGALGHPAYSGVTVGLLHGSCPDCLVLCADASEERIMGLVPRPSPARIARLYEQTAALVKQAPVVAVSVNTKGLEDDVAQEFLARVADETGLPTTDPLRHTATPILKAILEA
ncbi:MAG: DUF1611 domain-containing protein [Rubrobacteraceae bacterium]